MSERKTNSNSKTQKPNSEKCQKPNSEKRRYSGKREEVSRSKYPDGKGKNDVSWYIPNSQLAKDVASLPYSNVLGTSNAILTGEYGIKPINNAFPGLMAIDYIPTFGEIVDRTSAINVAATKLYTFVRHMNSGSANYDSPDLMLYVMAMDSVYSVLAHFRRIYQICNTYNVFNRYYPQTLIHAVFGYDPAQIYPYLADFRAAINAATLKASQLCVPNTMPLFLRHTFMNSNIYLDSSSAKAQSYIFTQHAYYVYSETTASGGSLSPVELAPKDTVTPIGDIVRKVMDSILDPILASEDMNIMSGDILKAYGFQNLYKLSTIGENEFIQPVYNEEVLSQIHNMRVIPFFNFTNTTDLQTFTILQDNDRNCLVSVPHTSTNVDTSRVEAVAGMNFILNSRYDNPTPEDNITMSRLMSTMEIRNNGLYIKPCSECVVRIRVVNEDTIVTADTGEVQLYHIRETESVSSDMAIQAMNAMFLLSQFDWAPLAYIFVILPNTTNMLAQVHGDMNFYAIVGKEQINRLNDMAMLGLLGIQ